MNNLQRLIEHLLLKTGASRAVLQVARPSGTFAIEAEAVQHGQQQFRHSANGAGDPEARIVEAILRSKDLLVENSIPQATPPASTRAGFGITARMIAPLLHAGTLAGLMSLHHSAELRWSERDEETMRESQAQILAALVHLGSLDLAARSDLRSAAVQAILDRVRIALDVQRCTFRQPVQANYAFPVTFESRADGVMSLLGDFTIVQTGQPVIVKLLAERKQVIQEDCRVASTDPLFHKMLAHYGGMCAQMVTPFIVDDQLKGVLSVHELRNVREWTDAEKALAAEAAALIGAIFEVP